MAGRTIVEEVEEAQSRTGNPQEFIINRTTMEIHHVPFITNRCNVHDETNFQQEWSLGRLRVQYPRAGFCGHCFGSSLVEQSETARAGVGFGFGSSDQAAFDEADRLAEEAPVNEPQG